MERNVDDTLSGVFAEMRQEKPLRPLVLHTEAGKPGVRGKVAEPARRCPEHSVGRSSVFRRAVATGIAAAAVAGIFVFVPSGNHSGKFVCYVNGERIVDRQAAEQYTRDALIIVNTGLAETRRRTGKAFDIVNTGLKKSTRIVSAEIRRVDEILGGLTKDE